MNEEVSNYWKKIERCFEENNRMTEELKIILSPSGKYELTIDTYNRTPDGNCEIYTKGIVKRVGEDTPIAEVKRTVNNFFHFWITHPNGNEYLLCAETYVSNLVINLSQRIISPSFVPEAPEREELIWYRIYPSPDKMVIAVFGMMWGYKTEVRFYDFSNPDNVPYEELGKTKEWSDIMPIGWDDNDTFVYTTIRWRRLSDNKSATELSLPEIQQLDDDPDNHPSIENEETGTWKRSVPHQ